MSWLIGAAWLALVWWLRIPELCPECGEPWSAREFDRLSVCYACLDEAQLALEIMKDRTNAQFEEALCSST